MAEGITKIGKFTCDAVIVLSYTYTKNLQCSTIAMEQGSEVHVSSEG